MTRWYRAYCDAHRNPKVVSLSDREFRLWHRLLATAAENDGKIPPLDQLKRLLNVRLDHLLAGVERLIRHGLIDRLDDGYEPHNWSKRQYKSDTSTERVRNHRRSRNVSETPPETETDTETDTDNNAPAGAGGVRDLFEDEPPDGGNRHEGELFEEYSAAFEEWWAKYPNKTGKRKAAKEYDQAFNRLTPKCGPHVHLQLLAAVIAQCRVWKRKGIVGRYIPHATTWLHQSRYLDAEVQSEVTRMAEGDKRPDARNLIELSPATPKPAKRATIPANAMVGFTIDDEDSS